MYAEPLKHKYKESRISPMEVIEQSTKDTLSLHAFGCVLGAFLGDALGSYLEFSGP